ncbi:MAG: DUF3365 domain-containing protein [Gammaproteobacteria bacterium]|nr:DUF3365 domain-containing protein [Gammaproteobacteria bacterium]
MKPRILMLALATCGLALAGEESARPSPDSAPAAAAAAAQALGAALKAELEAAVHNGGPVAALGVCQLKAPDIAARISAESGLRVSRTSLRPRNPDNAPNAWQTEVLRTFEARKAAGEDPAYLSYSAVVDGEFRFMKAIPTAPVCLTCHGERLAPEVTARLAELYPQDQATGFRLGDLRGAFVIVKPAAARP